MQPLKLIKQTAKEQAKFKTNADKNWHESFNPKISKRKAEKLRKKAKYEYAIADSIGSAQKNLPNMNYTTKISIASGNTVDNRKSNRVNTRVNIKVGSKRKNNY